MENIPGGGVVPFFLSSNLSLVTRHWTQVLSFHILPHSFAVFWARTKLNSFLFNRFRTLCQEKTHGVGADQKRRRPSRSDGGICEKGVPSSGEKIVDRLTVTKNIDRLTVAKNVVDSVNFPVAEAEEVHSSGISPDALARWCSPRAPRTASPPVPPSECWLRCTSYFQNGDQNACS